MKMLKGLPEAPVLCKKIYIGCYVYPTPVPVQFNGLPSAEGNTDINASSA